MKRSGGRLMAISLLALVISGVVISAAKTMNTDPVLVQQMGLVFALGVFGLVGGFLLWLLGVVFGGAAVRSSRMKKCPQCAEDVKADAQICRFCRHEFALRGHV